MSDVAVSEIAALAAHAAALRAELKEWERGFAAANGGRKAGRNDIKQAPEIATKYKEYSRLKAQESSAGKAQRRQSLPSELQDRHKKRKHSSPHGPDQPDTHSQTTSTPRKSTGGIFQTPSKTRTHPSTVDPYDSPSVLRRLFSPSTHMQSSSPLKTAIGPTPQRDGKALGLFDLLSESGGSTATPSATRIASLKGVAAQTPSKKRKVLDTIVEEGEEGAEEEQGESHRVSRTPASSGKKYMLSALFATPTTLRYSAMVEDDPSTSRNLLGNLAGASQNPPTQQPPQDSKSDVANLETPSFLRRSTSGLYSSSQGVGGTSGLSPIPIRKPPQFVGKGLSQLVQGLRDMEEERLEDEWDVLREIEIDQEQEGTNVDVPDSQALDGMGRTYKKKGQKRTTRLVRMKPVIPAKPRPSRNSLSQSQSQHVPLSTLSGNNKGNEGAESEFEDELEAIAETQANRNTTTNSLLGYRDREEEEDIDSLHSISEAEPDADSDSDPEYGTETKPLPRTKSFSEKMKEAIGAGKFPADSGVQQEKAKQSEAKKEKKKKERDGDAGKENKKPSTRKVNPQAHANYRSLKIRNRGGRGGRNFGRFRRR
ncbi:DNA replication/checkpoint protein [Aspergillus pseudoustus]|uniref:DNA replication regulator SLD2 n=1 Tax=Aspergillus pseudoustus TaxID=1810923 RepID=A0ABR4IUJ4_9EURO